MLSFRNYLISLKAFSINVVEASIRFVPSFVWLFLLPLDPYLELIKIVEYLAVSSFFLFITNMAFDKGILYWEHRESLNEKNIIFLQFLRTSLVAVFFAPYAIYLRYSGVDLGIEFGIVAALVVAQSLEVGDWFLRAKQWEKSLAKIKLTMIIVFSVPATILLLLGHWFMFHVGYVLMVAGIGTIPFCIYVYNHYEGIKGKGLKIHVFVEFLVKISKTGKNFFISSLPNIGLRRITPILLLQSDYSEQVLYLALIFFRFLDAITPVFVALTNHLFRIWSIKSFYDVVVSYIKFQFFFVIIGMTIFVLLSMVLSFFHTQYYPVFCAFSSVFMLVAFNNQRNPLSMALDKTYIVPASNFGALIPLSFLLWFGPQAGLMQNGTLLYPSFLFFSLLITQCYVIYAWSRGT